jgi:sugar-specific transcriptional regulator TrmB
MPGACCPGKTNSKMLSVKGQQVGITHLEEIIEEALQMMDSSDEETMMFLISRMKIYNYIPPPVEKEYAEAALQELLRIKSEKSRRG